MREKLRQFFEPKQLAMIEAAFEISSAYVGKEGQDSDQGIHASIEFGRGSPQDSRARLTAIMQNIVDNKGEFRP